MHIGYAASIDGLFLAVMLFEAYLMIKEIHH